MRIDLLARDRAQQAGDHDLVVRLQPAFNHAQPAIQRVGAWEGPRLPPPTGSNVRITLLVSDGLYLGEGPFGAMQRDPIAAPVIKAAGELLELVVDAGTK